ncbi:MAG: MBL fold metallo-hydrolase [Candidatus Eisenbacteria bacterium]|nr:MBL fold metallo-hydrolase [Candidatus Eisenbacteria bacterium]
MNCYILGSAGGRDGVIIDPGDEGERILRKTESLGLEIKWILNTHGHPDHTGADWYLMKETGACLLIHASDEDMLALTFEGSALSESRMKRGPAGRFQGTSPKDGKPHILRIEGGDVIGAGDIRLEVIHTPGHTMGGVCFVYKDHLFSGDTLFAGSIGRTDLPGGSYDQLINSITKKILPLGDDTKVYPGHGPSTTVGIEKEENPFLS